MSEYRQEFDSELDAIESKVIELFAMVAEGLPAATRGLLDCDSEVFATLLERDRAIDALYLEVEGLANREIVLQAPVADDLRFLLSVLRIVPELERSHDLVVHIAASAGRFLGDDLTPRIRALVEQMGSTAARMWQRAADAWYQRDKNAAGNLEQRDEELDELHGSLIAELASAGLRVSVAMDMALIARDYERLGAHAVNIARRVVYLAGTAPRKQPGEVE
jgi:phosphate transport system protein